MLQKLQTALAGRVHNHHYRVRQPLPEDIHLNFSTNDYLGLSQHPAVISAYQKAAAHYGVGSGSAYLIAGYSRAHRQLEEELAEFLNIPRVLLFSCGYMANLAVITTLIGKDDLVFADKLSHASIIDGCLSSKAKFIRYPHCNMEKLQQLARRHIAKNKLFISEGIFSMEGSLMPPTFFSMTQNLNSLVFLDDAHGIGVLGKKGQGSLNHFNIPYQNQMIIMGTMGKAFGSYGAFVAGNETIIETLIQFARTYIYTTAITPATVEASRTSLKLIQEENWRQAKLFENVAYFQKVARQLNLQVNSNTPIQPIIIGDAKTTLCISRRLAEHGILAKAILPPTVPVNSSRLRISLSAMHERHHLDHFFECLENVLK